MVEQRTLVRPGGRTESNRKAVADAVLQMVASGNFLFDIQSVADRSGVSRSTIRRRWGTRDALLAAAMAEHTSRLHIDLSGDWRVVLRRIAFALRDFLEDPVEDALGRLIAISADDDFTRLVRRHWRQIYVELSEPLVAAQKRGELAPDIDITMVLHMLSSVILTFAVYVRVSPDDRHLERIVRQVIRGMAPPKK